MRKPLEKFQQLLRELFQFEDAAQLDFGIYRIMKLRRERMEQWLTVDLPARAKEIIEGSSPTFDDDLTQRLEGLRTTIQTVQHDAIDADGNLVALQTSDAGKEYAKLFAQQQRAPVRSTADLEILVYNHLYDFFLRYYESGDFIAKRRWSFAPDGRDTYTVPWNGEEVVLHWANKDQYYIKTGERFTHYRWESGVGERTFKIEFQLTNADLPANNNKDAKKKFYLPVFNNIVWDEAASTVIVPFHWRGLVPQDQIEAKQEEKIRQNVNDATRERLLAHAAATGVPHLVTALMAPKKDPAGNTIRDKDDNPVPLLRYHLNRWTRKNESDFFIHKDLRRFLAGELDYFLKSVVLNLDNLLSAGELRAEPNFRLLEAVKKLGTEITDFLAQLENFQKALFEKKKFIVETSWCLTLDRIPAALKEVVFEAILANDRQWEEWEKLYNISCWSADPINVKPRTREFLETFQHLPIDTNLGYDRSVVDTLTASIENVDTVVNGVLVGSENFQALSLLLDKFVGRVKCIYIDPPYNTGSDEFFYRDHYRHSSWLSMMTDRLVFARRLLHTAGAIGVSVDNNELEHLLKVMDSVFGPENRRNIVAVKRGSVTGPKVINPGVVNISEFMVIYSKSKEDWKPNRVYRARERDPRYNTYIENRGSDPSEWIFRSLLQAFADSEGIPARRAKKLLGDTFTAKLDAFVMDHAASVAQIVPLDEAKRSKEAIELKKKSESEPEQIFVLHRDAFDDLYLIGGKRILFYSDRLVTIGSEVVQGELLTDIWDDTLPNDLHNEGGVELKKGKKPEKLVGRLIELASEKNDLILDFFVGSGTACAAAQKLGRKWIGVEMDPLLYNKAMRRLKNTLNGESSGISQVTGWKGGGCFKTQLLEQYEDALDNIDFDKGAAPGDELPIEFRRDYELRYSLDWESRECPTRLAVEKLETPFDYTLTLRRESGTETVKPDVPETFAYLIGLHTRRRFWTKRDNHDYLIYTGILHGDGTETAIVWRTCREWNEDEFQKEKDWWREERETLAPGATRLYVNAGCAIEGHLCLDLEFKKRMHPSYATV